MTTFIVLFVLACLGAALAASKGRSRVVWFVICFCFPVLGLLVLAVLPNKRRLAVAIATAVANAQANNQSTQTVVVNIPGYAPMVQPVAPATTEQTTSV